MIQLRQKFLYGLLIFFTLPLFLKPAAADTIYSVNSNSTVSAIDTGNDSVIATISLPSGSRPSALCLNPVTPRAYTLNPGTNSISTIDTADQTVVNTISSPRFTELTAIACDPTGRAVLIGNNDGDGLTSRILYMDTASYALDDLDTVVGRNPGSIVFNRTGSKAFVLNQGAPSISAIDTSTKLAISTTPLLDSDAPYALAMHTQDTYLYVVNLTGNSVTFINPATMEIGPVPLAVGNFPNAPAVSNSTNMLYVADYLDTVSLVDPASKQLTSSFNAPFPGALIERNDGRRLYITSLLDDVIRSYDVDSLSTAPVLIPLPDGSSPQGLATLFGSRHELGLGVSGSGAGSVNWPFNLEYTAPTPANGSIRVPEGISVVANAVADSCSTVSWSGCDSESGGGTRAAFCTVNPFSADKAISVLFTANTMHSITFTVSGGNGTISCPAQICDGGSAACLITPAEGFALSSLQDNGNDVMGNVTGGTTFQIHAVGADHSILAGFTRRSFTVTASTDANGSISPDTAQTVDYGNNASFTLTPNNGFSLVSVTGCGGSLNGTIYTTGQITGNCTVSAAFTPGTFTVTSQTPGGGGAVSCQSTVTLGGSAICTVTPDTGYHLTTLNDNGTDQTSVVTNGSYQITNIAANHDVVALFAINQFPIVLNSGSNGNISGPATVSYGDKPTYAFLPSAGYHVSDVAVGGVSVGAVSSYTFPAGVTGSIAISSTFGLNQYQVTPTAGTGGSFSPSAAQSVSYGSTASFTVYPDTANGYRIASVSGCGGTLSGSTYTTGPVTAPCSVSAAFTLNQYQVTPSAGTGGSISPTIVQNIIHGGSTSFTITPDTANGYSVSSVTGCGGTLSGSTYTTGAVTAPCSVSASFSLNQYQVTPSAGTGGGISPATVQNIVHGNSTSFTITPDTANGYKIATVTGCGGSLSGNTYTTVTLTSPCNVTTAFILEQYAVTPTAGTGGSITPNSVQNVIHGSTASFTVTPDTANGYRIASVSGCGGTLSGSTYTTGPVTAPCSVSAAFTLNRYQVTPSAGTGGSISPAIVQNIIHGGSTSFTITPDTASGYSIDNANVSGCGGTLSGTTYTTGAITANCTISAVFEINSYSLTASSSTGGSISGPNSILHGGTTSFTITPDTAGGYKIASVTGTGCGDGTLSGNTYTTGTITSPCNVTASFILEQYAVTPSAGAGGTISPVSVQNVTHGSTASFTITPDTAGGFKIASVTGCGGSLSGTTYTTAAVTATCSVAASFVLDQYLVTPTAGTGGTILPAIAQTVTHGSTTSFTITPDTASGYKIASATGCGGSLSGTTYTTGAVTATCSVAATFLLDQYLVTPSAGTGGTISPATVQKITHGSTTSFTITPAAASGYKTASVTGCGGSLSGNTYTTGTITSPCNVTASFILEQYAVTPSAGAGGTISPVSVQNVTHGSTASFTITPDTAGGFKIASVTGCGGSLSGTTYTTAAVTATCSVAASFVLDQYLVTPTAGTGGTILPAIAQTVTHGSTTSFTITPDTASGYKIASVTGCGGSLSGSTYTTGAITANCTISAVFEINKYSITTSIPGGNGAVSCTPPTADYGSSVSCTVTPANGYQLATLYDNGIDVLTSASTASYTISNITANHALSATFSLKSYAVTIGTGSNGRATPSAVQTVTRGNTISFSLAPDTGYHTVSPVGGSCGGALNGATYTTAPITADCTVTAEFALNQYTVSATAGNGGSISPDTRLILHGGSATFTLAPGSGYSIGSASGCGGALSGAIYTTGIISGDCSVSATFNAPPAVTASVSGGNGTATCTTPTAFGGNAHCVITPDNGYHLSLLTDNGVNVLSSVANKSSYSLAAVTSPHSINASFAAYSLADALQALRYAVKIAAPNPDEYLWLDVAPLAAEKPGGNNSIDIMDALILLKHTVGTYAGW